ncbi:hypothetical protein L0U85_19935 [Glycomyces sp. L485]|uniref:hypothetical protein n=1 Tax=Glycomyces sp. L485 TaxID=2909235 RepID=UPI001F4BA298|nr:hypothetical protein [Glycomyces sp. L485]MCH7233108.1 hypothetical protein [Glycomyces sp. L485]
MKYPRELVLLWLSAAALHGVVGLYWFSIGPGDYRYQTVSAGTLLVVGVGLLTWWWVRAVGQGRVAVSVKAQMRYRRAVLLVAYGLFCAPAAFAAGIVGNSAAWHQFVEADPQIVRAEATTITDRQTFRSGVTVFFDGYAVLDGQRYAFKGEPVDYGSRDEVRTPEAAELWAVFAPANPEAGFVLTESRSDAESMLEFAVVPLLPLGLAAAGCCWVVQRIRVRRKRYFDGYTRAVERTPVGLLILAAVPLVLWLIGIVLVAVRAAEPAPFQPLPQSDPASVVPILIWMLLLIPGSAYAGVYMLSSARNPVYRSSR